jgi:nucleoid-associated protein YgaU
MFETALDIERTFGQHPTMHRTRVRRRRLTLLVVAVTVAMGLSAQVAGALGSRDGSVRPVADRIYVVEQGDTLWAIASRVARGQDPRPVVDAIEAANGVEAGSLQPGTVLHIPTLG